MSPLSMHDAKIIAAALTERGIDIPEDIQRIAYPKRIINLTPHEVTILSDSLEPLVCFSAAKTENCARVLSRRTFFDSIESIPVFDCHVTSVANLPAPERNTFYIVSSLVAAAAYERTDLLTIGGIIRDSEGLIIGATCLQRTQRASHGES